MGEERPGGAPLKRVLVLVEGRTEERFIKDVLRPALWSAGLDATPRIAVTKRVKRGPDVKGGVTDYQKVENDLRRLLTRARGATGEDVGGEKGRLHGEWGAAWEVAQEEATCVRGGWVGHWKST